MNANQITWRGFMTMDQLRLLEQTWAIRTSTGWVMPQWLVSLRRKVEHCHVHPLPQLERPVLPATVQVAITLIREQLRARRHLAKLNARAKGQHERSQAAIAAALARKLLV